MKFKSLHLIIILLTGISLSYVLFKFDFGKLSLLSLKTVLVGLIFLLVSTFLRTVDSQIVLRSLGRKVSFLGVLQVNLVAQVANVSISSKIAAPIRVYLFKTFLDIEYSQGIVVVTLRVLLDVFATAVIACLFLLILPSEYIVFPPEWPIALILLLISGYLIMLKVSFERWAGRGHKIFRKIINGLVSIHASLKSISAWVILLVAFIQAVNIIVISLFVYFIIAEFGYHAGVIDVIFSNCIADLVAFFSMVPLGLGMLEASFVIIIHKFGCPEDIAATAILIRRILWTFLPVLFGIPILLQKGIPLFALVNKKYFAKGDK